MKLYNYKGAPNPLRLDLYIAEKGIEIETQQVDLMKGEQFEESFKAINPLTTVPALVVDEGEVFTEVIAMYSYLESKYPDIPLMGTNEIERAKVLTWDHRCYAQGLGPIADALRNSKSAFKGRALAGPDPVEQVPELVERGRLRIGYFYNELEGHLKAQKEKGYDYMVGNTFTVADIAAFVFTNFSQWVSIPVPDDCPTVKAWQQQIAQRPAIASCLAG